MRWLHNVCTSRPSCERLSGSLASCRAAYGASPPSLAFADALPTSLCKQACDETPGCPGFIESINGQTCYRLAATVLANATYSWKLPASTTKSRVPPRPKAAASAPSASALKAGAGALPPINGFQLFSWFFAETPPPTPTPPLAVGKPQPLRAGDGPVITNILQQCGDPATPDPSYTPSLMTVDALLTLCATHPASCTHVLNAPSAARGNAYAATKLTTPHPTTSTYVRTDVCTSMGSACGGEFLACVGLDLSQPAVLLKTYDLPSTINAQACVVKGCHFFAQANDDSTGNLYTFAPAADPAQVSYILLA